jgi:hypothetical protein
VSQAPLPDTRGYAPLPIVLQGTTADRRAERGQHWRAIPPLSFLPLSLIPPKSRSRVSNRGAAIECCTADFDQNFTKR